MPNTKGLKRGKNTSYDDIIEFIEKNYSDLFDEILTDFKTYSFGDMVNNNGRNLALYFYRKVGSGSNYKFNNKTNEYEPKNDEITQIMQERGFKFEKPTGDPRVVTINVDLSDAMKKCRNTYYKELIKQFFITLFKAICKMFNMKNIK